MANSAPRRIFLIGFSFSGKSAIAPLVAKELGWRQIDLDDLIEEAAGKPIPEIFAGDGEAAFRRRETEALRRVCSESEVVVATGGGVVLAEENRRLMGESGFVVCLEARPDTILSRLQPRANEQRSERPLLKGADPLTRIRHLKSLRQPLYALADFTAHTDDLTPDVVAKEIAGAWRRLAEQIDYRPERLAITGAVGATFGSVPFDQAGPICNVKAESATYPIYAGWGVMAQLPAKMHEAGLRGVAYVFTDSNVESLHGESVVSVLRDAGFEVDTFTVPAGEESKSLENAARAYDWLTARRAERGHTIVALGGGMIGDLAGFIAATYLRGMPLVQVPTSLMAMVDASVGGKVAVNQREAKNLIGSFYQPRLVFADVAALSTLPERELTSGWAEVVKHALIMDADLMQLLEERVDDLRRLSPEITTEVVRRSMALKAGVVAEDEREVTGRRAILNYGHTVGHALETATGYGALYHGEAVALGMLAAADIGAEMGLTPPELVLRQRALLERFGLLRELGDIRVKDVLDAIALDKKVEGKSVRWVLLDDVGRPVLHLDMLAEIVEGAVRRLLRR